MSWARKSLWVLQPFTCASLQALAQIFNSFFQDMIVSILFHIHISKMTFKNSREILIWGKDIMEPWNKVMQSFQFNLVRMYWQKIKEFHVLKENKCNSKNGTPSPKIAHLLFLEHIWSFVFFSEVRAKWILSKSILWTDSTSPCVLPLVLQMPLNHIAHRDVI